MAEELRVSTPDQPSSIAPDKPFDPLVPDHLRDVHDRLAVARNRCPVSHPRPGLTLVARHQDVRDALNDPNRLSNVGNFSLDDSVLSPYPVLTSMDPPEHTAMRTRLRPWFSASRVRQLEPQIRSVINSSLAELPDAGSIDLYAAYIRRIPAQVVYAHLGLPSNAWTAIESWSDQVAAAMPSPPADMPAMQSLMGFLVDEIERRQTAPATGTDVVDALVHAGSNESELSTLEVASHLLQLVMAGTDTTRSLATNLVYALLVAERWGDVAAQPHLISAAIEESLRHDPPLQYVVRTAVQRIDLGGSVIPAGDRVVLSLRSAGADDQAWGSDAATFDLARSAAANNVSFGFGIHTCLGAVLARTEVRLIVAALATRYPSLRLASGFEWTPVPGSMLHRPQRLDVELS